MVPEIIQTSAMDCGPAALYAVLRGFGFEVNFVDLRASCRTSVAGTSIDALESIAQSAGLEVEQSIVPIDNVFCPEARTLPAIAVMQLPSGLTHFVVLWRALGPWIQVADPARGRRWVRGDRLVRDLYRHSLEVDASAGEWTRADEFVAPLRRRMEAIGVPAASRIEAALAQPGWRTLAALDAVTRTTATLVAGDALPRGSKAAIVVDRLLSVSFEELLRAIPATEWFARPGADASGNNIVVRGAVLLHFSGSNVAEHSDTSVVSATPVDQAPTTARRETPMRVLLRGLSEVLAGARRGAIELAFATTAAVCTGLFETLGFCALAGLGSGWVGRTAESLVVAPLVALLILGTALEAFIGKAIRRAGRRIEAALRRGIAERIGRAPERFFRTRAVSDLAHRAHLLHKVRDLPQLLGQIGCLTVAIVITAAAIAWLTPVNLVLAAGLAVLSLGLPLCLQRLFVERDLAMKAHSAALSQIHFDALAGATVVRAHASERILEREHTARLSDWARAARTFQASLGLADVGQTILCCSLVIAFLVSSAARRLPADRMLLLVFWAMSLPVLAQELLHLWAVFPGHRNAALRLHALWRADDRTDAARTSGGDGQEEASVVDSRVGGVEVEFRDVECGIDGLTTVRIGSLTIEAGTHVAIVGPSGAGKSTLLGLLLGWAEVTQGNLRVDGNTLTPSGAAMLRARTVWVDPSVQLWNRSLYENLTYGHSTPRQDLSSILDASDLHGVLEALPAGSQSRLGDGGGLLSGGEGQRVRFGRALQHDTARLVLLDEPFRGLESDSRRELLARARRNWRGTTLFCVTHDVADTMNFDIVLVVADGRVVEHGSPAEVSVRAGSRYRHMLETEQRVRKRVWGDKSWKSLILRTRTGVLDSDGEMLRREAQG